MIYRIKRFSFREDWPDEIKLQSGITLRKVPILNFINWITNKFHFLRKILISEDSLIYEVMLNGNNIGESYIELDGKNLHILWLGINDSYRKNGYASSILKFYIEKAKELGFSKLTLEASRMGFPIYRSIGFTSNREPIPLERRSRFRKFIEWCWGMDLGDPTEEEDNYGDLVDMEYKL